VRVGLIADDLTGACDSATPFLRVGRVEVGIWPHIPAGDLACAAVSTESREEDAEQALERTRRAAGDLRSRGFELIYRKVDSMLRGNLAADIEGVLADWGGTCLLAPALPAEGRVTRHGRQVWESSSVDIAALLGGVAGRVSVRDAETDADLLGLAAEVARTARLLPAGSAGLAAQLPAALGLAVRPPAPLPSCRLPLVLIGSAAAFAQALYAMDRGWTVQRRVRGDVVDLGSHDSLFLSGGGTAAGVLGELGAEGLELLGEAAPRVPVGRVRGGHSPGLPVALKSGSFGGIDVIAAALSRLAGDG
jgi:D-threonate/D-erythronate kinase